MKLPDAIVYVLCNARRGLTTDQIADIINMHRLHVRLDGNPVSSRQIYAVVCSNPAVFAKEGGIIRLIM